MLLLAGDIGGTKTDLALYSAEGGLRKPLAQAEFHSASYPSLEALVKEFLAKVDQPVDRACFGGRGARDRRSREDHQFTLAGRRDHLEARARTRAQCAC